MSCSKKIDFIEYNAVKSRVTQVYPELHLKIQGGCYHSIQSLLAAVHSDRDTFLWILNELTYQVWKGTCTASACSACNSACSACTAVSAALRVSRFFLPFININKKHIEWRVILIQEPQGATPDHVKFKRCVPRDC